MTREQERFESEHLRAPSAQELAGRLGITPEELLALLALRTQSEVVSLDAPVGDEEGTNLAELLGETDASFENMERREWMEWILLKVGETERKLLLMRYRDGLGQRETAKRPGNFANAGIACGKARTKPSAGNGGACVALYSGFKSFWKGSEARAAGSKPAAGPLYARCWRAGELAA